MRGFSAPSGGSPLSEDARHRVLSVPTKPDGTVTIAARFFPLSPFAGDLPGEAGTSGSTIREDLAEHPSHMIANVPQDPKADLRKNAKAMANLEAGGELMGRSDRNPQEPPTLGPRGTSQTLGDIERNRSGRPPCLIGEPAVATGEIPRPSPGPRHQFHRNPIYPTSVKIHSRPLSGAEAAPHPRGGVAEAQMGERESGFGCRASGIWFRVSGTGLRVPGFEFRKPTSGIKVPGFSR